MPKLTKKEKVRRDSHREYAQYHPQFVKTQNLIQPQSSMLHPSLASTYEFRTIVKPQRETQYIDFALVRRDVIKITIFTIGALLIQSMIYFLLQGR